MYFQETLVSSLLNCKVCESKLRNPVVLPCGNSICNECVDFLKVSKNDYLVCSDCHQTHIIPENGFTINKKLAKILRRFYFKNPAKFLFRIIF